MEELRERLKQGKVYRPDKIEQALGSFFRKGNISTLAIWRCGGSPGVGEKPPAYRAREGLEPPIIPERVIVCMSASEDAPRVLRTGARIADGSGRSGMPFT